MTPAPVSCIVPVFNGERFLGEALESILAQTASPAEILVVDDGSTDATPAVAARFEGRIRYVSQSNAGPAAARNHGLRISTGEFIAFLDADDVWLPQKLALQLARFRERPELGLCVAHAQNFWVPELKAEEEELRSHRRSKPIPGYVTGTLLARRSLFDAIGGFNLAWSHCDDTEWFLRAEAHGALRELLPDVLLLRRVHPGNRSRARAGTSRDEYLQLLKATLDRRRSGQ